MNTSDILVTQVRKSLHDFEQILGKEEKHSFEIQSRWPRVSPCLPANFLWLTHVFQMACVVGEIGITRVYIGSSIRIAAFHIFFLTVSVGLLSLHLL